MGPGWWRCLVVLAGVVLVSTGCTALQKQASNSPEASASLPAVVTSPSSEPTPAEPSPSAKASPSPARLVIKSAAFHLGEVGVNYAAVTATATGGVKPYKWSISSGALPGGLALSTGGSTTGKPAGVGTFAFVIQVSDSAGAAVGVARSILVFRQLRFTQTSATCGNSPSDCAGTSALRIAYTGGIPLGRPTVKVVKVTATINHYSALAGCLASVPASGLPPGTKNSAIGGILTLTAGPRDNVTWCGYYGTVILQLVDRSPCGAGFLCASSNTVSVLFSL